MPCSPQALCCALALALAAASPAWAADPEPAKPAQAAPAQAAPEVVDRDELRRQFRTELETDRRPEEESFTIRSVLWMFAAMGFVIAAIYITLNYGLRKLMGVRMAGAAQLVQVLGRVPLDQKKSILVLRAAGEYLLVGAAEGGINLICKLDTQEVERLERESRVQTPGMTPFLQKLLSRRGGPPPPSA